MGKKTVPFIDKSQSRRFNVVHRSVRDPLAYEENSKHVLQEIGEAVNYGIEFDDQNEYDYLQHLKEFGRSSDAVLIEVPKDALPSVKEIPKEAFHQDQNLGVLTAETLNPDVQEVMAALEEADEFADEFDEDFIAALDDGSGQFDINRNQLDYGSDDQYSESDDDEIKPRTNNRKLEELSQMSMSSSALFRNDKLSLLDDQFDNVMQKYDDEEVGELHPASTINEHLSDSSIDDQIDIKKLEAVMDEFLAEHSVVGRRLCDYRTGQVGLDEITKTLECPINRSAILTEDNIYVNDEFVLTSSSNEELERERRWDCQTILSTYSNTANRPALLNLQSSKIPLSHKTGLPLGMMHEKKHVEPKQVETVLIPKVNTSIGIPRQESLEQKHARKQLAKQQKRQRRGVKKATQHAFKEAIKVQAGK